MKLFPAVPVCRPPVVPAPTLEAVDRSTAAAILGVGSGATGEEVDHAFRAMARASHPDAGGDRDRFELLMEARNILTSDATKHRLPLRPVTVIRDDPWWRRVLDALRRRPTERPPRVH